jgi:hypothetical protein
LLQFHIGDREEAELDLHPLKILALKITKDRLIGEKHIDVFTICFIWHWTLRRKYKPKTVNMQLELDITVWNTEQ